MTYFSLHWLNISSLFPGWILDRILGDPEKIWHPVVTIGKVIATGEKYLNKNNHRFLKGALFTLLFVLLTYLLFAFGLKGLKKFNVYIAYAVSAIGVFYCLAGKTLGKEVKGVFAAVDRSPEEGRKQLSRIVGRDTSALTPQEIRTAAIESLAENLSDGVIAPMFWFALLGLPGMLAYKVINTFDSMIGYRNERYEEFGKVAARLDDAANYIPARLTALVMLWVGNAWRKHSFVRKYGRCHTSPNAGYPEAAMAAILNCRFGGTHTYFGNEVEKPYIGEEDHTFTNEDLHTAIRVCRNTEMAMVMGLTLLLYFI